MDTQPLIAAGLTGQQAEAYALLLEHGSITAPNAAKSLALSRTNAYKLLDKLVELGLAQKQDINKKQTYEPTNPLALVGMVNEARNRVVAQEEAVKQAMDALLARYFQQTEQPTLSVVTGKTEVAQAFRSQIGLRQVLKPCMISE
jgi:sugar-specific transcriptional regulator TrmB